MSFKKFFIISMSVLSIWLNNSSILSMDSKEEQNLNTLTIFDITEKVISRHELKLTNSELFPLPPNLSPLCLHDDEYEYEFCEDTHNCSWMSGKIFVNFGCGVGGEVFSTSNKQKFLDGIAKTEHFNELHLINTACAFEHMRKWLSSPITENLKCPCCGKCNNGHIYVMVFDEIKNDEESKFGDLNKRLISRIVNWFRTLLSWGIIPQYYYYLSNLRILPSAK